MFCPNCKREVGGIKVADASTIGTIVLILAVLFGVLGLVVGPVISAPVFLAMVVFMCFRHAPLECPFCRTRLVGEGEKEPVYDTVEEAEGKVPSGYCYGCKHENAKDAVYCSQCGANLNEARPNR